MVQLFKGEVVNLDVADQPRELFWHFPAYLQSYKKVYDEQRDPLFRSRPCSAIRKGSWKLIQFFESGELELYDLSKDQGEQTNLATVNSNVAAELLSSLKAWQVKTGAAIPIAKNPGFDEARERAAIEAANRKSRKIRPRK